MDVKHPPHAVRITRPRYAGPAGQTPTTAAAEPTWPGLTTAQSLAVASQFGITLAVGVGLGLFAGQWLDGLLHTGMVLTLIGAFVGLVGGVTSTIALYRATLRDSALEWREEENLAAQQAAASQRRNV